MPHLIKTGNRSVWFAAFFSNSITSSTMRCPTKIFCLLVTLTVFSHPTHGENLTRFRGDNGQGISNETQLPVSWTAAENVHWKTQIPGNGWSSPIIFGDTVFLTTTTENGASCRVICIDRKNGNLLWNVEAHRKDPGVKRNQNSYATPQHNTTQHNTT